MPAAGAYAVLACPPAQCARTVWEGKAMVRGVPSLLPGNTVTTATYEQVSTLTRTATNSGRIHLGEAFPAARTPHLTPYLNLKDDSPENSQLLS